MEPWKLKKSAVKPVHVMGSGIFIASKIGWTWDPNPNPMHFNVNKTVVSLLETHLQTPLFIYFRTINWMRLVAEISYLWCTLPILVTFMLLKLDEDNCLHIPPLQDY